MMELKIMKFHWHYSLLFCLAKVLLAVSSWTYALVIFWPSQETIFRWHKNMHGSLYFHLMRVHFHCFPSFPVLFRSRWWCPPRCLHSEALVYRWSRLSGVWWKLFHWWFYFHIFFLIISQLTASICLWNF